MHCYLILMFGVEFVNGLYPHPKLLVLIWSCKSLYLLFSHSVKCKNMNNYKDGQDHASHSLGDRVSSKLNLFVCLTTHCTCFTTSTLGLRAHL